MSPYYAIGSGYAYVFVVWSDGYFNCLRGDITYGVRPVVNLKSNVKFVSGNGTSTSPYVVEGT